MEYIVDLHCHSNFSDGKLTPEELFARAIDAQVKIFSLTDHDSIDGIKRLHLAKNCDKISIINGIEFSVRWKKYNIHILGLNIDIENSNLSEIISLQKESRILRAEQISSLLADCGVQNAYEKAHNIAKHDNIGRPHFAAVLVNEGVVSDMQAAFRQYLGEGKKAFVRTAWISLEQAVRVIRDSGGNAVIAHPLKYKLTRTKLHELINDFKLAGGDGIEVISGEMNNLDIQTLVNISLKFDLLASTGSDFHADKMSRVAIGRQKPLPAICTPVWDKWSLN
jgi:3',5'-nucleoside bisphosphate phosphatase